MQRISWWNKTLNYFEDFKQENKFVIVPEILIALFFVFWLVHKGRNSLDGILPNPVNIFNHIGNVDSVIPALFVGYLVGFVFSRTINLSKKRLKYVAVAGGTLVGLVCNILIEIPFGMQLLNQYNVADGLDVVWGTTLCLLTLFLVFRVRDK